MQLQPYHFVPPGILLPITVIYELSYGEMEMKQGDVDFNLSLNLLTVLHVIHKMLYKMDLKGAYHYFFIVLVQKVVPREFCHARNSEDLIEKCDVENENTWNNENLSMFQYVLDGAFDFDQLALIFWDNICFFLGNGAGPIFLQ